MSDATEPLGVDHPQSVDWPTEYQQSDFARGKNTQGRAPETRAATGVELRALAVPGQPLHRWLIKLDEQVKRPDLAAVGVPGDLDVHPGRDRLVDLLRLMRQQKHGQFRLRTG